MNFLTATDTIIACSTGTITNSAISVIRISGPFNLSDFKGLLPKTTGPIEPRKVYFDKLCFENEQIDEVCFTYFESPKSYNGENILELSVHGNLLNVERIINIFVKNFGLRQASPGEFTYRALKNKKMTLSQVEGLDLFIHAQSSYALKQGLSLLSGELKQQFLNLLDEYIKLKSALELQIDFSDDVGDEQAKKLVQDSFYELKKSLSYLHSRSQTQSFSMTEPEIVLFGAPNAGKSTFFNKLIGTQRAIVSSVAGTTRDYVHELLHINGVNYRLVDTAGIRASLDQVEEEGIKRSLNKVEDAFFKVLLINPFDESTNYCDVLNLKYDLVLFTHDDLDEFEFYKNKFLNKYGSIGPEILFASRNKEKMFTRVSDKFYQEIQQSPLLLSRHKNVISSTYQMVLTLEEMILSQNDAGILSYELNQVGDCLSELIGIISPDQVLNSIFSNFCIGK